MTLSTRIVNPRRCVHCTAPAAATLGPSRAGLRPACVDLRDQNHTPRIRPREACGFGASDQHSAEGRDSFRTFVRVIRAIRGCFTAAPLETHAERRHVMKA